MSPSPLVWGTTAVAPLKGDVPHASPPVHRATGGGHLAAGARSRSGDGEITADLGVPAGGAEALVGVARLFEQLP